LILAADIATDAVTTAKIADVNAAQTTKMPMLQLRMQIR
jgi:hypothetical protein